MSRWVESLEEQAEDLLPEAVHRYFRQGARDGVTAAEAVSAWDGYRFLPRVLHDVTQVDTSTDALGVPLRSPMAVAPTTLQRAAHPEGEVAMARAVADVGSLLVVSSNAGCTFEDIAATGVNWWLQAYLTADRAACLPLLRRAADTGARAVVLTVDTPVVGTKYDVVDETVWDVADPAWLRVNFPASYGESPGHEKATDLGLADIAWLGEVTGLPVVVKGVLRPDDAAVCRSRRLRGLGLQPWGTAARLRSAHGGVPWPGRR